MKVGNLINVYVKRDKNKTRKLLMPRAILSIDRSSGTVTVSTGNRRTMDPAFKYVRAALAGGSFAMMVQESIGTVDREMSPALDDCTAVSDFDTATSTEQTVSHDDGFEGNISRVTSSKKDRVHISWTTENQFYFEVVTMVHDEKR